MKEKKVFKIFRNWIFLYFIAVKETMYCMRSVFLLYIKKTKSLKDILANSHPSTLSFFIGSVSPIELIDIEGSRRLLQ